MSLKEVIGLVQEALIDKKWPVQGKELKGVRCVFTGGEPLLQLDVDLVKAVRELGLRIAVETNGSVEAAKVLELCDEVSISPKSPRVHDTTLEYATCLKILVPKLVPGTWARKAAVKLGTRRPVGGTPTELGLVLQPVTPREGFGHWTWKSACTEAESIALTWRRDYGQPWRVIPQTHVMMGLK